jgi:hypothetical protein
MQFKITPKAFANLSPGFERSENLGTSVAKTLGIMIKEPANPERVWLERNPFRVDTKSEI